MSRSLFITGTDTGVGKTHVTAAILRELRRRGWRAAAFKPIACGPGGRKDARIYRRLMSDEISLDMVNPICLRHSLAPRVAAALERRRLDLRLVGRCYQRLADEYDLVLVEGAGGLLVPVRRGYFMADLARELNLPLIIVSRLSLGTINHTLLTVRQAQGAGLRIAGVILNDTLGRRGLAERTNISVLPRLTRVPLLGVVEHGARPDVSSVVRRLLQQRGE
jgi:dethiobiotin synthetase